MTDKNTIVRIASELIRFRTLTKDKQKIRECFVFVKELLKSRAVFQELVFDGQPILTVLPKQREPKIYCVGHMDVVAGKNSQFRPLVKNGRLYGRGSYDMKTQNAILLSLFLTTDLNFGIVFTSDEECSKSKNGAWFIANKLTNKAKLVIVPDGQHDLGITRRVKGLAEYKFTSVGKSARFSYPWRGVHPGVSLMKFYLDLKKAFPEVDKASDSKPWYTTYNLVSVDWQRGPITPEKAEMNIIINFTTKYSASTIKTKLFTLGKKYNVQAQETFLADPYEIDVRFPDVKLFKNILDKKSPKKTDYLTMSAISDVRHFQKAGIKTILTRIKGGDVHGPNEYADIDSGLVLFKVLKEFIKKSNN